MNEFIKKANLPQNRVKIIICGTKDKRIIDFFNENNIELLFSELNERIDVSTATHADMAVLHIGEKDVIVDKAQQNLKADLQKRGLNVTETESVISGKYPFDISLNVAVCGNFAIGNHKYTDKNALKLLKNKKLINVKQGYCKCSVLVVDESSVITDDESINRILEKSGIDSLLIQKGDIALEGHEYGFIGGASGKISKDTVLFFGDITKHRNFCSIEKFLNEKGCGFVCSDGEKLRDIGGFIPLFE